MLPDSTPLAPSPTILSTTQLRGYTRNNVISDNPIWNMCFVKNKKNSTNMDILCGGCRLEFPKTNATRWGKANGHLLSCSKWRNTKEMSQLLKYRQGKSDNAELAKLRTTEAKALVNTVASDTCDPVKPLFSPKSVQDMVDREFCLAFVTGGIPFSFADSHLFRQALQNFAQVHRARQVPHTYTGPNRKSLFTRHLPHIQYKIEDMISTNFIPSLLMYSVEISIDGYSTKCSPRHNIIIASNGRSLFLGCIPTLSADPNADHLKQIMQYALHQIDSMVDRHADKELQDLFPQSVLMQRAKNILWLSLDGASVNCSAAGQLGDSQIVLYCHCITHSINLFLKDFLNESWIKNLVPTVKNLLSVFKNKAQVASWLNEVGGKALCSYPVTRFAYFLLSVKKIARNRPYMITVVLSEVFTTKISKVSAQERLKLTTARDIVLG
ncbi:hypothetical protein GEMRC1_003577 [Eukaryota sp. GEM-RC1]